MGLLSNKNSYNNDDSTEFVGKRVRITTSLGGKDGNGEKIEGTVTSIKSFYLAPSAICIDHKRYIFINYIVSIELI